jgi:hypothetical protein
MEMTPGCLRTLIRDGGRMHNGSTVRNKIAAFSSIPADVAAPEESSASDRARLNDYLDEVREIERRFNWAAVSRKLGSPGSPSACHKLMTNTSSCSLT